MRARPLLICSEQAKTCSASADVLAKNGARRILLIDKKIKMPRLLGLKEHLNTNFPHTEVSLSTKLADIQQVRIIITVTNAPEAIIKEEWIRPGMVFVDDAQPPNVSRELADRRRDILVLKVLAEVPGLNPNFDFKLGTPPHITFTCLAETVSLAAHEWNSNYTVGYVTMSQVSGIEHLTEATEVKLPEDFYGYGGKRITSADVKKVGGLWQPDWL